MDRQRGRAVQIAGDIEPLVTHLDDNERTLPVVIVSPGRGEPRYGLAPNRLAERLVGRATVWMLASVADSCKLGDRRRQFATYGGAVRVVGCRGGGTVIRTDNDPDRVVTRILTAVDDLADIEPTVETTACYPEGAENPVGRIEELRCIIADQHQELVRLRGELAAAQRALHDRIPASAMPTPTTASPTPRTHSTVFADPERQFRHELELTWLHRTPEDDREQWPLRDYSVGSRFLASLDTPLAGRQRILDVAVDVLTRRAFTMTARAVHPHTDGGVAACRRGDTAYRAYVRHRTPGAARLLWWECSDGTVEFAWVGHHDDPLPRTDS